MQLGAIVTMRDSFLPFSPPLIGKEEIDEVVDTLRSDWITTGPKVKIFEQEFASYVGAPAALAVSSGTHAMQVALAALGIGPGDEVISTPMTFCATIHVIEQVGAVPVLVDVEQDTLNIDPNAIEQAITSKTKALMPVHLYGHPCDMNRILSIAEKRNLYVIEDAAHAVSAKYNGRMVGALGTMTAFSFYATKNLTTAEGGMLTGDLEAIDNARIWSLHGMSRDAYKRYGIDGSWYYEVILPGFKCNMTDIQAALGIHQLRKLEDFQKRRRDIANQYFDAFSKIAEIELPAEREGIESAWQLFVIRLHLDRLTIDRNRFIQEMKALNIGTSVHFIPIHIHPYYRDKYNYRPNDFPVAHNNYLRLVSLPINLRMSNQDVDDVIEAVHDVITHFRR
jgi:dTDP-4-amino-4,6-dideoxygalactose transaminase